MKAGSKRRRTQTEIRDQDDKKELEDAVHRENEERVGEQNNRILLLEQRLAQMEAENAESEMAKAVVKRLRDAGDLEEDITGALVLTRGPNMIGNA